MKWFDPSSLYKGQLPVHWLLTSLMFDLSEGFSGKQGSSDQTCLASFVGFVTSLSSKQQLSSSSRTTFRTFFIQSQNMFRTCSSKHVQNGKNRQKHTFEHHHIRKLRSTSNHVQSVVRNRTRAELVHLHWDWGSDPSRLFRAPSQMLQRYKANKKVKLFVKQCVKPMSNQCQTNVMIMTHERHWKLREAPHFSESSELELCRIRHRVVALSCWSCSAKSSGTASSEVPGTSSFNPVQHGNSHGKLWFGRSILHKFSFNL